MFVLQYKVENQFIWDVFVFIWFPSLSMIILRFTHIIAFFILPSMCSCKEHSIVWIYISSFTHLPVDENLVYFQFGFIKIKLLYTLMYKFLYGPMLEYLGVKWPDRSEVDEIAKLFSRAAVLFSTPTHSV